MVSQTNKMTGYPSIDRPWLKFYSEKVKNASLPQMTMYQYVYENNHEHMDQTVFIYFGRKITYSEFFNNVKKTAEALTAMGIGAGDVVTIMSMQTPETIYLIYGLNYIGAVANLIYATSTAEDIISKVELTSSKALFVLDAVIEQIDKANDNLKIPVVVLKVSDSMPSVMKLLYKIKNPSKPSYITYKEFLKNAKTVIESQDCEAPAIIVYTSGTTGKPKGVVLSNNALNAHSFQEMYGEFNFKRGKLFLFILPPFVGFGISHIHLALNAGVTSDLWIQLDQKKIVKEFMKVRPSYFVGGPAFVDEFLKQSPVSIPEMELFVGGGGALASNVEEALNVFLDKCKPGVKYANGYGLTETSSTLCCSTNVLYKWGSVGLPMARANVKVIDVETGNACKYGEIGELWFSTPSMMTMYYNDPKSTEEMIVVDENGEKWVKTGDLGCVDEDGYVFIKGRLKRIYITVAKDGTALKLFPQKIEELLIDTIPEVEKSGEVVVSDEKRMNVGIVFLTLKENAADHENVLKRAWETFESKLPEHEMPVVIEIIDSMPITPSGKIDYKALEERIWKGRESSLSKL